jgi:hypothetical protein
MATRAYNPIDIARQFKFVREAHDESGGSANTGQRVEGIQKWGGGVPGDSWCAYFATMVLDICYQGHSPIGRTGSCDEIFQTALTNGWVEPAPRPGDLYLRVKAPNDAHHVGFIIAVRPNGDLGQIAGNTSEDGKSSNGDGVYERDIPHSADLVFVRLAA